MEVKNLMKKPYRKTECQWTVYIHIVPSEISDYMHDKYYVGITSKKPSQRWGCNGNNYKDQYFTRAISKYGWNNIKHIIIATKLSEIEAKNFEKLLIEKLDSTDPTHGYNISTGGDGRAGMIAKNRIDVRNQRFGRWIVLDQPPIRYTMKSGREKLKWRCICDCGNYGEIYSDHLLQGKSKSCGCLSRDINSSYRKGNNYVDIGDGMRLYTSNCDKSVIIDYDTYKKVKCYTWAYNKHDNTIISDIVRDGKKHTVNLLRFILGLDGCSKYVSLGFINGDKYDWRKSNISIDIPDGLTYDEFISILRENIKGISWARREKRWVVKYNNKSKSFKDYNSAKLFSLQLQTKEVC